MSGLTFGQSWILVSTHMFEVDVSGFKIPDSDSPSVSYFHFLLIFSMLISHLIESGPLMKQYSDYIKAALFSQLNIVVFTGLALLGLVSWNVIPVLIAAVAEALWLMIAPGVPAFRAYVASRETKLHEIDSQSELRKALDSLPEDQLGRFRNFAALVNSIRTQSASMNGAQQSLLSGTIDQAYELKSRYISMLSAETQMDSYLRNNDARQLQQKLNALASELNTTSDQLRSVKAQQKEILQKRLEKLHTMEENSKIIKAQLESFQDLVQLLKEQTMTMNDPHELNQQVHSILTQIQVADSVLIDLDSDSLEAFDRELESTKYGK